MLIRLLCVHEMTKHVCKISHLNSKQLLRKLQKMLGATLFCRTLYSIFYLLMMVTYTSATTPLISVLFTINFNGYHSTLDPVLQCHNIFHRF